MSSDTERTARDAAGNEIAVGDRAHRLWFWGTVERVDPDGVHLRFEDDCSARNLAGDTGLYMPGDLELASSVQTTTILPGGES